MNKKTPAAAGGGARVAATRAVAAVIDGSSLDTALARHVPAGSSGADSALIAALAYGVLRDWRLLNALVDAMAKKRPPALATMLLCVGLFQLRSMRVPSHAAVHATVDAAGPLKLSAMKGLLNALLRRYQREADLLEANLPDDPLTIYSHPGWLGRQLKLDWPEQWLELLAENNRQAPMTLRVNTRRVTVTAYLERLQEARCPGQPMDGWPEAIVLDEPVAVEKLPGFADGDVSVQDAAAQLAAGLLDARSGMRVLDACAAPGGKTAHLLERSDCAVTALDIDPERCDLLGKGLARLGLAAEVMTADASAPDAWWDGRPFDRILIDAPCSGSGVIRRHPDIKWLRRADDLPVLQGRQQALLAALWPLLAPGGQLLFATCSTLRAEGAGVVSTFVADRSDAQLQPIEAAWGEPDGPGRRIRPGEQGMDGFFYARLTKRAPVAA